MKSSTRVLVAVLPDSSRDATMEPSPGIRAREVPFHGPKEYPMKKLLLAAMSALLMSSLAQAAETCDAQAQARKLAGAAKTSFMKKCEADAKAAGAGPSCEAQAADKKLAGAAKASFVKKCHADEKTASPSAACEAQAAEKKLAGAARSSFVKKCVQDAKG